jgi:hypothetical protein
MTGVGAPAGKMQTRCSPWSWWGSGHESGADGSASLIDEIVREGARRMLTEALQAEVDAYVAAHAAERGKNGRRKVVRNGYHQPWKILTSAGAIEVTASRVNDERTDPETGAGRQFSSAIAACALAYGLPLATLNTKDFRDYAKHDGLNLIIQAARHPGGLIARGDEPCL